MQHVPAAFTHAAGAKSAASRHNEGCDGRDQQVQHHGHMRWRVRIVTLTLNPWGPQPLAAVSVNPAAVTRPGGKHSKVTLGAAAPAAVHGDAGEHIPMRDGRSLHGCRPMTRLPSRLRQAVTAVRTVTITATYKQCGQTATLTVNPAAGSTGPA